MEIEEEWKAISLPPARPTHKAGIMTAMAMAPMQRMGKATRER